MNICHCVMALEPLWSFSKPQLILACLIFEHMKGDLLWFDRPI